MKITGLNKSFGDIKIFENFSIEFEENKTTAIMGASGIGKSTLLNAVMDLTPYEGTIVKSGKVAAVFSEPALLKNLSVRKNLEYAVGHAYPDKTELKRKTESVLKAVELYERRDALPKELSTGMAQRVSLARGFLLPSKYLVMDEAFRGLDTALKSRLKRYFLELAALEPRTVLMITHDLDEALSLADRLVVLDSRPARIASDITLLTPKESRSPASEEYSRAAAEYMRCIEGAFN